MSGLTEEESKVIEVMQCDLDTARRALQEFRNDADQAIDALLTGTVSTLQASSSSLSPAGPAVSPSGDALATPSHERQHSNTADGGWGTPPNDAAGPRRSERLDAKKRTSPIDLTNDEDEDFRKAMAASLESEKDRQKRHEEYGIEAQNGPARRSRSNVRGFRNGKFELASWPSLTERMQWTSGSKSSARGSRRRRASTPKKRRKDPRKTRSQRQKEQHELQLVNEEDEALTRAIEASMLHSHQSTRAQSPQLSASHLEALGANRIRAIEKPVAILAPSSFLQIFASALQALYASGSFRNALLRIRLADIRIQDADVAHSMENFWRGASPSGIQRPSEEAWMTKNFPVDVERDAIDCLMRLSTLFTFMTYTKRTLVVAEDVIAHSTMRNYAYTMNSERQSATNYILTCYVQTVLDKLSELGDGLEKASKDICDSTSFKRSFQSCAVAATDPQKDQTSARTRFLRKESYETVVNSLTQTGLYNTVHRALYRCLAEENVLFSEVADTLFFTVGRDSPSNSLASASNSNSQQANPSSGTFTLETRIYLDAFMSARRNGVRLGLDTEEVAERQKRIDELEQYRKSITTFQGDDARTMLKASKEYFETLYDDHEGDGEVANEADQVRIVSVKEAHERLGVILQHLEQEIEGVEREIQEGKQAIEDVQQTILASFERDLQAPEFQTMPYDLQAVLMEDANGNEERETWAYVRHGGYGSFDDQDHFDEQSRKEARWWRIRNGEVTAVDEDVVTSGPGSITFLVYTASRMKETVDDARRTSDGGPDASAANGPDTTMEESGQDEPGMDGSKPTKTIRLDSGPDWWAKQPLVEAIEYDNATFGKQLAEELRAANETVTDNAADRTAVLGE